MIRPSLQYPTDGGRIVCDGACGAHSASGDLRVSTAPEGVALACKPSDRFGPDGTGTFRPGGIASAWWAVGAQTMSERVVQTSAANTLGSNSSPAIVCGDGIAAVVADRQPGTGTTRTEAQRSRWRARASAATEWSLCGVCFVGGLAAAGDGH